MMSSLAVRDNQVFDKLPRLLADCVKVIVILYLSTCFLLEDSQPIDC